jgi:hypothetical protein
VGQKVTSDLLVAGFFSSTWISMGGNLKDFKPYFAGAVEVDGFAWCFSHVDVDNLAQALALQRFKYLTLKATLFTPI